MKTALLHWKRTFLPILFTLLLNAVGMTKATAQVTLTQTSTSDFLRGTGQNIVIADDQVSFQSKMTDIYDFEATTNLPQTLMNHQIVTWQNYVFCVGGYNGSNPVNTVYRAEQQDNGISSWATLNALPEELTHMAVVASQQHLIVMGGKNDDGLSNKIYVATIDPLNASLGEWMESPITLPQPLWGARAISVHDNIYLVGGATTDSETAASNKVYCLKLNSRGNVVSITEVTALPEARNGHAVATYDSKIYVTGGHDTNGTLKATVYAATVNLDGTLGTWVTQTNLPVAVSDHATTCTNGILVVIGGMGEELPSNQVYYTYLDGAQLEWVTSSVVLSVRTHSGSSCTFGDKIFFAGGQSLSGSILNFMRYASVSTGNQLVNKACFVSKPFDLGTPLKTVQQLSYNLTQGTGTSYEILYRLAGEDLTFGNWISASTNNPISLNETKSAIQYMFRMTSNGTENIQIEDISITFSGYTQLAGELNDISVLSLANSPYMVTDDISFTTGVHDIEAGVVIYFMENTELKITQACVHFNGTENAPILLTYVNPDQSRWNGVYFTTTSWNHNAGVYNNNVSTMEHTTIANAGYGENQASLRLYYTDQPTFTNCTFTNSFCHGIRMDDSNTTFTDCIISDNNNNALDLDSSSPVVTSTTMTGNDYAVYIRNSYCDPTFNTCSASSNNFGVYSYTPDRNFVYDESTIALFGNAIEIRTAGGNIYNDHAWNYYDSGYQVDGNIIISNSSNRPTLTIAAGNTIRMAADKYITVNYGGIHAIGTVTDSITFTSLNGQVGGWSGFNFYDHSDDDAASSLRYCIIEKASTNIYCEATTQPSLMYSTVREANGRNIDLNNSELNLDAVHISDAYDGIYLYNYSTATMVMTSFDNLSHACVWNYNTDCTENFYTCSMSNSNIGVGYNNPNLDIPSFQSYITFNNVTSPVGLMGGTIRPSRSWLNNDYSIFGDIYVRSNNNNDTVRLTIDPGTTLRFDQNKYLVVGDYYNEEIYAEGIEEAPITFTSLNGESGGWNGLRFYGNTRYSLLKYCVFENGNEFNVYVDGTSNPVFEDCEFRNSNGYGLRFNNNASPTVKLSSIHDNANHGIHMDYNCNPIIKLSCIRNNANHGIYMNSNCNPIIGNSPENGNDIINNGGYAIYQEGSNDIDMTYNFFGTMDSVYIEDNLVRDKLDYQWDGRVNVFPFSMLPVAANTISGSMLYDGNPEYTMEGSTIKVKNFADSLLYQTTTDAMGHFSFNNISVMGAKKIEFEPNVDVEATITTADALAVMLHYVHETMLTGSRLMAADVNGSLTVNGTDALLIQKRYVNQIETFPMGDVYYNLYDTVVYNNVSTDLNITVLCYGDVNGSYQALRNGITLQTEGQMLVSSDQVIEIPVRVKTSLEAGAISLKLAYPEEYLSIEGVTLPNGEEAMLYDNNGLLTISWYSLAPMYLSDDEALLTLVVRTKDFDSMEESIVFGLDTRSELADGNAIVLNNVELVMPEMVTLGTLSLNEKNDMALSVYPNPMSDHSVIRYNLPAEGRVSFVVYDLLGNTIRAIEVGRQYAGQHEIELTNLASGVYVGRLAVSGGYEEVQIVKIVVE